MLDFFEFVKQWLTSGIYEFFQNAFASLIEWLVLGTIDFTIWSVQFAWGIAKTVLTDLQVSQHLNDAWAALPAPVAEKARFFRLTEVIINLLSGVVTKIVFRFIPGM